MPPQHNLSTEVAFADQTLIYREDAGTINTTLLLSGFMENETTISIAVVITSPNVRGNSNLSGAKLPSYYHGVAIAWF